MSDAGAGPFAHPPGEGADTRGQDDPVSWLQIEQGWQVVSSDGTQLGTVAQVAGAPGDDIFDGLAMDTGRSPPLYVPGEQVGTIYPGHVTLRLTAAQAAELAPYHEAAPQTTFRAGPEGIAARLSRWLRR